MRSRELVAWLVLASAGSLAQPSLALNATRLTCTERAKDGSIRTILRLDLRNMTACDDFGCRRLTRASPTVLRYDCPKNKQSCALAPNGDEPQLVSTGGPWVNHEHFTFDMATFRFQHVTSGQYGDRMVHEFNTDDSGICTPIRRLHQ